MPGPGTYNPNPEKLSNHRTFQITLKEKLQTFQEKTNPVGPGQYPQHETLLNKNKILSTERRNMVPLFSPPKVSEKRLQTLPETEPSICNVFVRQTIHKY